MHRKTVACLFGTAATVAILAGCASKPQVTSQQESSRYLSRAGRNYAPPGSSSDPWGPYVREASRKYDVPEKWIREVMRQESGGRLYGRGGELITSGAGAMGLMQVMPATYDDLRGRYRELGDDPYDPHNNILAGTAYLREMYDIYGAPGFLAAYNAGPGRLDDYLTRNRTLPSETRRYVANIGPRIAGYEPERASPGAQYAMNAVPLNIPAGSRYPQFATQFASTVPTPLALNPPEPIRLNRPVEVAEAPRPFIQLNRPAPSAPKPELPQPVAVARAEPARPFITLNPVTVAQAEPMPRYIQLSPPATQLADAEPARSLLGSPGLGGSGRHTLQTARAADLPLPEPPPPAPPSRAAQFAHRGNVGVSRPIEVAEFPEPPRATSQRYAALAELTPLGPRQRLFGLIPSANAAPANHAVPAGASSGSWAVQVGAFANQNLAHSATAAAREHVRDVLGSARTVVAGVRQPGGTLYRARLGGLSHEAASEACERLSRARTNCMVVSPDAQR